MDQVCVSLAGCVEEVELLAPIALALGLEAVVARWLGLIALEMALPACQAASACSLGFVVGRRIAGSLPRGQWLARGRVIIGRWCSRVGHADVPRLHAARLKTVVVPSLADAGRPRPRNRACSEPSPLAPPLRLWCPIVE